jgi:pyridoxal phosphate-dependent aminotransferase EpsN
MIKISDPGIKTKYTVTDFENAIKEYVGYPFAVATNTGTIALQVAIEYSVKNYSESIEIPSLCFVAVRNAVKSQTNKDPVFTGGIHRIDVMNYGFPCKKQGEILDASEALGGDIPIGYEFCTLSFNWNKPVTCGSGGMILCKRAEMAWRIRRYINQGKGDDTYFIRALYGGTNGRMNDIQASMGMEWFKKLPETTTMRKAIHERYLKAKLPIVRPPKGFRWNYWITLMRTPHRERIFDAFRKNDIECRAMFTPHTHQFPDVNKYAAEVMCLPSSPGLTREEQNFVIKIVKENL